MTLRFKYLYYFAFIAIVFSLSGSAAFAQTRSYRVSDRQIQTVLNRIQTGTGAFRQNIERTYNNDDRNNPIFEKGINSYVNEFENAVKALKTNFDERDSTSADVEEVLNRADYINGFMRDNRVRKATQNQWKTIRTDLNTLANYYRVRWNWNNSDYPPTMGGSDSRLTGTYRLNAGQSDDVSATIDRTISKIRYNANQRERVRENLESRLTSPENLMIEKRGQQITLGSLNSPQVSFIADGVSRSETSPN